MQTDRAELHINWSYMETARILIASTMDVNNACCYLFR